MGTDWAAKLIVGEKIKRKSWGTIITKYDENTGKPYETEGEAFQWYIGESEIQIGKENEEIDLSLKDILLHFPYFDAAVGVYGIKVAESDSNRTYSEATSLKIEAIEEAIQKYLAQTGRIPEIFIDLEAS